MAYVQCYNLMFLDYEQFAFDEDLERFWHNELIVLIAFFLLGIFCIIVMFGSVGCFVFCVFNFNFFLQISLLGWATELVVERLKIDTLTNILKQDATFFDHPETTNAKIITQISTESEVTKAVKQSPPDEILLEF